MSFYEQGNRPRGRGATTRAGGRSAAGHLVLVAPEAAGAPAGQVHTVRSDRHGTPPASGRERAPQGRGWTARPPRRDASSSYGVVSAGYADAAVPGGSDGAARGRAGLREPEYPSVRSTGPADAGERVIELAKRIAAEIPAPGPSLAGDQAARGAWHDVLFEAAAAIARAVGHDHRLLRRVVGPDLEVGVNPVWRVLLVTARSLSEPSAEDCLPI